MRRRRRSTSGGDEAEIAMSPLIDCVFLLLIFFLVTTVIKRKEKQIRVEMPDTTATIKQSTNDDLLLIGMNKEGQVLKVVGRGEDGEMKWARIENLTVFLQAQVKLHGQKILGRAIRIDADRDVVFQKAIDTLDTCKLMGFSQVSLKIKQGDQ